MKSWYDFYKSRMNERYIEKFKEKYKPFLDLVNDNLGKFNAEFGCGMGTVTKLLESKGNFTLIDNCPKMLELCKENIQSKQKIKLVQHDITQKYNKKFNLIFSHGVLEHFDVQQVDKILYHQLNIAPKLIHYVPSYRYKKPSFGDERLMDQSYWRQFGCEVIEFNEGYDYILIWK